MIRLLVVDDQQGVRQGLRMRLALEPDIAVVGEAADGPSALRLAADLAPDTQVVILTVHDDPDARKRAQTAGIAVFRPTETVRRRSEVPAGHWCDVRKAWKQCNGIRKKS